MTRVYLLITSSVLLVNYAGPVLSDLLVLVITWRATYKNRRNIEELGRTLSLSQVIFRDGESSASEVSRHLVTVIVGPRNSLLLVSSICRGVKWALVDCYGAGPSLS